MMQNNVYIPLIESELFDIRNKEDINYLLNFKEGGNSLIEKHITGKWRIKFVGEVQTPTGIYFSMPKNMPFNNEDVLLIKRVLNKYKRDSEGKELVVSRRGNWSAERAYFNRLKEYFLDFITYEFIYPLKRKKIHSTSPVPGGKVSVLDTVRARRRLGTGITYKTKDVENSDEWLIDDIYYFTIKELESRIGVSKFEQDQIKSMTDYLNEEGYNINTLVDGKIYSKKDKGKLLLDLSDSKKVVEAINRSQVGVIHYPIKNTLLEYYSYKQKADSLRSIDVIFTDNFERVWELILQDALMDEVSKSFAKSISKKFNQREITERFITRQEVEKYKREYPLIKQDQSGGRTKWMETRGGRYFICERGRKLIPDIFVELEDGKRFIGDAKYYKDPSDSNYDKEFYIYNDAQSNIYPMVVFAIPETNNIDRTTVPTRGYRRAPIENGIRELIIITVCVRDVINDAINGERKVLGDAINLIQKYSRKPEWSS